MTDDTTLTATSVLLTHLSCIRRILDSLATSGSLPIMALPCARSGQRLATSTSAAAAAAAAAVTRPSSLVLARPLVPAPPLSARQRRQRRALSSTAAAGAQFNPLSFQNSSSGGPSVPTSYFSRPSLPANTIIKFIPQQTAWIVERMGKFHRILEPGFAVLIPVIDRIAYVKSLKEAAMEIPSQSAITADNVTLELDGVLYTRVFDAYRARYRFSPSEHALRLALKLTGGLAMESRTPSMPFHNSRRRRCARRLAS